MCDSEYQGLLGMGDKSVKSINSSLWFKTISRNEIDFFL